MGYTMINKTIDELSEKSIKSIVEEAIENNETIVVTLESGKAVEIRPLSDLPVFEGYVPDGWKEAVY